MNKIAFSSNDDKRTQFDLIETNAYRTRSSI